MYHFWCHCDITKCTRTASWWRYYDLNFSINFIDIFYDRSQSVIQKTTVVWYNENSGKRLSNMQKVISPGVCDHIKNSQKKYFVLGNKLYFLENLKKVQTHQRKMQSESQPMCSKFILAQSLYFFWRIYLLKTCSHLIESKFWRSLSFLKKQLTLKSYVKGLSVCVCAR